MKEQENVVFGPLMRNKWDHVKSNWNLVLVSWRKIPRLVGTSNNYEWWVQPALGVCTCSIFDCFCMHFSWISFLKLAVAAVLIGAPFPLPPFSKAQFLTCSQQTNLSSPSLSGIFLKITWCFLTFLVLPFVCGNNKFLSIIHEISWNANLASLHQNKAFVFPPQSIRISSFL